MAWYILDAESANFETAREWEKPKQRDIDTTSAVVGLRVSDVYLTCTTERAVQAEITLPY